jgi:hypothetical protein
MDNGWTLHTLEKFLSERIENIQQQFDTRNRMNEEAVKTALEVMNRRLDAMNEFRASLSDQRLADEKERAHTEDTFLTKEIYGIEHKNLETLIAKNTQQIIELDKKFFALSELKVDKREGLSTRYMTSAIIFSAFSFLASAVTVMWNFFKSMPPK